MYVFMHIYCIVYTGRHINRCFELQTWTLCGVVGGRTFETSHTVSCIIHSTNTINFKPLLLSQCTVSGFHLASFSQRPLRLTTLVSAAAADDSKLAANLVHWARQDLQDIDWDEIDGGDEVGSLQLTDVGLAAAAGFFCLQGPLKFLTKHVLFLSSQNKVLFQPLERCSIVMIHEAWRRMKTAE